MATISTNKVRGVLEPVTLTTTTLSDSDTLPYSKNLSQILHIYNGTGSDVTVNILGDEASDAAALEGQGATTDNTSGFDLAVADGAYASIALPSIKNYCLGTVTVSGASGAVAWIEY